MDTKLVNNQEVVKNSEKHKSVTNDTSSDEKSVRSALNLDDEDEEKLKKHLKAVLFDGGVDSELTFLAKPIVIIKHYDFQT